MAGWPRRNKAIFCKARPPARRTRAGGLALQKMARESKGGAWGMHPPSPALPHGKLRGAVKWGGRVLRFLEELWFFGKKPYQKFFCKSEPRYIKLAIVLKRTGTRIHLIFVPTYCPSIMEPSNSGQRVNTSFPTMTSSTRPEFRISMILHK